MDKTGLEKFRQHEFILYIVSGIIVTLVNWLTYTLLTSILDLGSWRVANVLSISLSIIVAYVLNRKFVFQSKQNIFPEIMNFFLSRFLVSLVFEHGIMEFLLTLVKFDPKITIYKYEFQVVKAIGSVFVVLANYIAGKYFVFNNKNKAE